MNSRYSTDEINQAYKLLNLKNGDSFEIVKEAWRKHPSQQRARGLTATESDKEENRKINEAYAVLSAYLNPTTPYVAPSTIEANLKQHLSQVTITIEFSKAQHVREQHDVKTSGVDSALKEVENFINSNRIDSSYELTFTRFDSYGNRVVSTYDIDPQAKNFSRTLGDGNVFWNSEIEAMLKASLRLNAKETGINAYHLLAFDADKSAFVDSLIEMQTRHPLEVGKILKDQRLESQEEIKSTLFTMESRLNDILSNAIENPIERESKEQRLRAVQSLTRMILLKDYSPSDISNTPTADALKREQARTEQARQQEQASRERARREREEMLKKPYRVEYLGKEMRFSTFDDPAITALLDEIHRSPEFPIPLTIMHEVLSYEPSTYSYDPKAKKLKLESGPDVGVNSAFEQALFMHAGIKSESSYNYSDLNELQQEAFRKGMVDISTKEPHRDKIHRILESHDAFTLNIIKLDMQKDAAAPLAEREKIVNFTTHFLSPIMNSKKVFESNRENNQRILNDFESGIKKPILDALKKANWTEETLTEKNKSSKKSDKLTAISQLINKLNFISAQLQTGERGLDIGTIKAELLSLLENAINKSKEMQKNVKVFGVGFYSPKSTVATELEKLKNSLYQGNANDLRPNKR